MQMTEKEYLKKWELMILFDEIRRIDNFEDYGVDKTGVVWSYKRKNVIELKPRPNTGAI